MRTITIDVNDYVKFNDLELPSLFDYLGNLCEVIINVHDVSKTSKTTTNKIIKELNSRDIYFTLNKQY
jgi:hypothetical protein